MNKLFPSTHRPLTIAIWIVTGFTGLALGIELQSELIRFVSLLVFGCGVWYGISRSIKYYLE